MDEHRPSMAQILRHYHAYARARHDMAAARAEMLWELGMIRRPQHAGVLALSLLDLKPDRRRRRKAAPPDAPGP